MTNGLNWSLALVLHSDLQRKDIGSDSDPYVVVYEKRSNRIDKKTGKKIEGFVELGRTEVFRDNPNPIFETKFEFEYFFEETQILRFDCWDYDKSTNDDFIGSCTMEVGEILHLQGMINAPFCTCVLKRSDVTH